MSDIAQNDAESVYISWSDRKAGPFVTAVAVDLLILFVGWSGWTNLKPPNDMPPMNADQIAYFDQLLDYSNKCHGDFDKLSSADKAAVLKLTGSNKKNAAMSLSMVAGRTRM